VSRSVIGTRALALFNRFVGASETSQEWTWWFAIREFRINS
jgi:hypothetical protein